jgi:hypothetical protein
MRRSLGFMVGLVVCLSWAAPAWAFSCGAMYLEDVLGDPAVVSVVEAQRVLSVPGLIPGVSGGRDVLEPVAGWGDLDDDWANPSTSGSFVYPECLDVSEVSSVLIVRRELDPGPNLVDATAITDEFRQSLDTLFGTGVEAATGRSLVPTVLAATWQWIALAATVSTVAVRARRKWRVTVETRTAEDAS